MHPSPAEVAGGRRGRVGSPHRQWDVVAAVALGGVIGAEARYGLAELISHTGRQFPWSTLIINVTGCWFIGALMVLLLDLTSPHRLARPFLGVGVLGGYTTFSTFTVDAARLVEQHRPLVALAYVASTAVLCFAAVVLAGTVTQLLGRAIVARRTHRRP